VIKYCDDLIIELLAEVDNEDESDSDSGHDYNRDDDGGATDDTEEDLEEVPEEDAPQEQVPQPEPEDPKSHHSIQPNFKRLKFKKINSKTRKKRSKMNWHASTKRMSVCDLYKSNKSNKKEQLRQSCGTFISRNIHPQNRSLRCNSTSHNNLNKTHPTS
jgi:hypothetical protein